MIAVRNLVKRFGELRVIDGVSLEVRQGEVAALIGPSGGGKSTLLRCINGLETFDSGSIGVGELELPAVLSPRDRRAGLSERDRRAGLSERDRRAGLSERDRRDGLSERDRRAVLSRVRRRVGMVFQQFNLFPHRTVLGNVIEAPIRVLGQSRDEAVAAARALLDRVGLAEKLDAWPDTLSGGQQQRVAIARALAMRPEAILFDEPTSALDPRMAAEVEAVIADLAAGGQTMIVVTHSLELAKRAASTVHILERGRLIVSGTTGEVFKK